VAPSTERWGKQFEADRATASITCQVNQVCPSVTQSKLRVSPHCHLIPITVASHGSVPSSLSTSALRRAFCSARHMTGGDIITIDLQGSAGAEHLSFCSTLAFRAPRADPKTLAHDCTLVILPPPFVRVAPILSCDMTEDCLISVPG
jgi:hypothetical protein